MATSTNKGYELIATGAESGTWGATLNSDVFNYIDQNLGGITTKSLSSSNVTLSASEARTAMLRLTGTLTANVQVTSACVGFYFVENLTSGDFTVTVTNGVSGVVVPKGRATLIADATNGVRLASTATFPTGTAMLFYQNTAPTSWTKSGTSFNHALRVTDGTAGTTGGSTGFSTVFAARTIARNNLPNEAPTFTGSSSSGTTSAAVRSVSSIAYGTGGQVTLFGIGNAIAGTCTVTPLGTVESLSGGATQQAMDFDVSYLNVIMATKD